MVPAWPRARYVPGGGSAQVVLVALAHQRLPDPLPVSRRAHGMPEGEGSSGAAIAVREREGDPAAFVTAFVAPFADLVANDLDAEAAARAASCSFAYVITSELDDPDDLGHLQAAWAIAKCVCEQPGAEVVIDVYAARAHLAEDVAALSPERPFELMQELSLLFDTVADGTVAAWTAGLRKFGRPEVVLLGLPSETSTEAALALRDLAAMLADGERIELGDLVTNEAITYEARELPSAVAELVDGPALWLAPAPAAAE